MVVLERLARRKMWRGYRARDFAVIHASPPCQRYSIASHIHGNREAHPDLVAPCRELLTATARHFVMENVEAAPLSRFSLLLCGLMFDLKVFRHRRFESSIFLFHPEHIPHGERRIGIDGMVCVAGRGGRWSGWGQYKRRIHKGLKADWCAAMGIGWMTCDELSQAVPPAYTYYLGKQLILALENK